MKKGFTLIELLIVIAILAILTSAVVVVLNPAQLLAQARDSQRLTDLGSVVDAVSYYLSTTTSTDPLITTTTRMFATSTDDQFVQAVPVLNTSTSVGVGGWVAVALRNAVGGSPLATLPFDPVNNASFYYAYCGIAANNTFEVNANLESQKYATKKATDGGNKDAFYETGSNLSC